MNPQPSSSERAFIDHLHAEKIATQETRNRLVLQKLAFVSALFGLAALQIPNLKVESAYVLVIVPLIALIFDFYIMGEDYSVKRIGFYLQSHMPTVVEKEWEDFVSSHRDPFGPLAMPLLTVLLTLAVGFIEWKIIPNAQLLWILMGVVVCMIASVGTFALYQYLRSRIPGEERAPALPSRRLTGKIRALRRVIRRENFILTETSYRAICQFFQEVDRRVPHLDRSRVLAREYGLAEFLACVDGQGRRVAVSTAVLEDFRARAGKNAGWKDWFEEGLTPEGQPYLLPARWLCHASGLRHATVHLLLHAADDEDMLMLQVRSMRKAEAPGCIDLPVAGHVDGLQSYAETLRKEATEELALRVDHLVDLKEVDGYVDTTASNDGMFCNVEYHRVFQAGIERAALPALKPNPAEVASVFFLRCDEFERMVEKHADLFASGMKGTWQRRNAAKEAHR